MKRSKFELVIQHAVLLFWSVMVLFPIWTMVVNSFKNQTDIFKDPFGLPLNPTVSGYSSVFSDSNFIFYFRNSLFVTLISLFLILFFGSLAGYALAKWKSRISNIIYLFFIAGLMIPIRLGTINIFQIIKSLGLMETVFSLIPVYVAMGLPIATFVLTSFIKAVPQDLLDAAAIDGASRWKIYLNIIIPLVRPALGTVAIFNLIPIWNDIWFPLIFNLSENNKTLILGVSSLFGQYQSDWTKILVVLTLSTLPVLALYLVMSKQFIKGLTGGALKG
jgi:raffinose/stachyose/melibiose transport system permease protein